MRVSIYMAVRLAAAGCTLALTGTLAPAPAIAAPIAAHTAAVAAAQPWLVTLTIRTVPALRGVRFSLDGEVARTDAAGRAVFRAEHDFTEHTLILLDEQVGTASARYRFSRWAGQRDPNQAFTARVSGLPLRGNYAITAAFRVAAPVLATIVDGDGRPFDMNTVASVTLRRSDGTLIDYPKKTNDRTPLWLDAQVPSYRRGVLRLEPVVYSVHRVMVHGVNVVDSGRQRFEPAKNARPSIVVDLHDLTVRAHDALFLNAVGVAAVVTGPDGVVRRVPFGPDRMAVLTGLTRGTYQVDVTANGSVTMSRELRVSRTTSVDLVVVSRADMVVLVGGLLAVALGLLVVGRFRRSRRRFDGAEDTVGAGHL